MQVLFIGRVYPETLFAPDLDYNLAGRVHRTRDATDVLHTLTMRVTVQASRITVVMDAPDEVPLTDLRARAQQVVQSELDVYGLAQARSFRAEVFSALLMTGEQITYGTHIDGHEVDPVDAQALAERVHTLLESLGPKNAVSQMAALQGSLADFRMAVSEPSLTAFFCYRGVEVIRQAFLPVGAPDSDASRKTSWERLRGALKIERGFLAGLQDNAQRHGDPLFTDAAERVRRIMGLRQVILRYVAFVENGEQDLDLAHHPPLT